MAYFIHFKNMDDFDNWEGSPGTGDKTDEDGGHTHDHDHESDRGFTQDEAEIEPAGND